MLKVVAKIVRVVFGFALACIAAGLVTMLFVNTPVGVLAEPVEHLPKTAGETFQLALLTATHAAIFAFAFVLIIAALAEWLAIRSMSYYLIAGAVISALGFFAQYLSEVSGQPTILNNYAFKTFLTSGFFGGFVYWLAAGQFAGRAQETAANVETVSFVPVTVSAEPSNRMDDPRDDDSDVAIVKPVPSTARTFDSASLLSRLNFARRTPLRTAAASDDATARETGTGHKTVG